jgi:DNA gyrase/topoisomerase IV subunit B
MAYKTADITILEGLEHVRRRPAMYIGAETPETSLRGRLVEATLGNIVADTPSPSAVRLLLWKDGVITIAFDGEPLPIGPFARPVDGVVHPELYQLFMHVGAAGRMLAIAGGVLNGLCERLHVSTVSGEHRYRAVFGKGTLVSLLHRASCESPLGTSWLTFLPDTSIVTGELSTRDAEQIVARVSKDSVDVAFHDRTDVEADWW